MRRVLGFILVVMLLCFAGYGVAFQEPRSGFSRAPVSPSDARLRTEAVRESARGMLMSERKAGSRDDGFLTPHPVPRPESDDLPPGEGPKGGYAYTAYDYKPGAPAVAPAPQQLAVVISKSGLRFMSPRAGLDLDEIELEPEGIFVICETADVTTDPDGTSEVVCNEAAVIKAAGMGGKASQLRYKAGCLVLESHDADSLITRNKGDKTVFMLRAKTINVDLNTRKIEASDGSVVHLKPEPKAEPEAAPREIPAIYIPPPPAEEPLQIDRLDSPAVPRR